MLTFSEWMDRTLAAFRLVTQAEDLRGRLRSAGCGYVETDERHIKAMALVRRSDDRISRRRYRYQCTRDGLPAVTTAQVRGWMWANIEQFAHGLAGVDSAEIAGAACNALGLWDEHESIPGWVWRCGEWASVREEEERLARFAKRDIWVEKSVRYEPDGDVIWA